MRANTHTHIHYTHTHVHTHTHITVQDVHARFRTEAHGDVVARFNERFLLSLASCPACLVLDDELNVLPISHHARDIVPAAAEEGEDEDAAAGCVPTCVWMCVNVSVCVQVSVCVACVRVYVYVYVCEFMALQAPVLVEVFVSCFSTCLSAVVTCKIVSVPVLCCACP